MNMNVLLKTCDYLEDYVMSNKIITEEELGLRKMEFVTDYTNKNGFIEYAFCVNYIHYLSQSILGYVK